MGHISEATFLHMEISTALDKTYQRLRSVRRGPEEPGGYADALEGVRMMGLRIRDRLNRLYGREREELIPRMKRIIGPDMEEVGVFLGEQESVLSALDDFFEELDQLIGDERSGHRVRLAYLELLFDAFVERYEARCHREQAFFQTHATVLYPGGLSTE